MGFIEMFILAIVLITIGFICLFGNADKCPNCLKWWAKVVKDKKEIDRENIFRTVDRTDQHRNRIGMKKGTTQRQEQIRATTITYEEFRECKYCQHQWTLIYSNDIEGWD